MRREGHKTRRYLHLSEQYDRRNVFGGDLDPIRFHTRPQGLLIISLKTLVTLNTNRLRAP